MKVNHVNNQHLDPEQFGSPQTTILLCGLPLIPLLFQPECGISEIPEEQMRTMVGAEKCKQPYSASRLNISGMSYGALSRNAVLALNKGAEAGGFYHNTGEGSVSPHHLKHGGDVVHFIPGLQRTT